MTLVDPSKVEEEEEKRRIGWLVLSGSFDPELRIVDSFRVLKSRQSRVFNC